MKQLLQLIAYMLFTGLAMSQTISTVNGPTEDLYESKAHILEHLDLASLSPGNLWDFGLALADPSPFDGAAHDELYANPSFFGAVYGTIMSMPMASSEQLPLATIGYSNEMNALASADAVPLMTLDYTLNRIKPEALEDGILYNENGQLKETTGNSISPFETLNCFISSPMRTKFTSPDVNIIARPDLYFTNSSKTVTDVEIDFGLGDGFTTIGINTAYTFTYSTPDEYDWIIKYSFSDGTSYENRVLVKVEFDLSTRAYDGFENEHTTSNPSNNTQVDIHIDYNCGFEGLRKPLIYVEGFNPPEFGEGQNLDPDYWETLLGIEAFGDVTMYQLNEEHGYDLVYIDYHDGAAAIQNNAAALIEAIEWINTQKAANGSTEPNVLIGSSMGGLVGKFALRTMELNGQDHETELFVAMDSPMRGANVPLGAQYAARDIPNIEIPIPTIHNPEGDAVWYNPFTWNSIQLTQSIKDVIPGAALGEEVLNRPASRQMLILQCIPFNSGSMSSLHDSFMAEFHGLGDLEDAREIAVTNGSQAMQNQFISDNEQLLNLEADLFLALTGVSFDIEIWSLPNFSEDFERIYYNDLYASVLGIPTVVHSLEVGIKDTPSFDIAPGGYYDIGIFSGDVNDQLEDIEETNVDVAFDFGGIPIVLNFGLEFLGTINLEEITAPNFCFIPAVSAIDIDDSFDENGFLPLNKDISDNLSLVQDGSTHFKNFIGEIEPNFQGFDNHSHEIISERNARLMRFEMMGDDTGISQSINSSFNFGESTRDGVDFIASPFFRTVDRLQSNHTILGNSTVVSVNESGAIGGAGNTAQNTENSHFDLYLLNNSCGQYDETIVSVQNGAKLIVGDPDSDNTATVHVYGNSILSADVNGEIRIKSGSKIEIHKNGKLRVTDGDIILEDGA